MPFTTFNVNCNNSLLQNRLNETIEKLELKCEELTKQYEDVRRLLEQERRKNERIQESSNNLNESVKVNSTTSSSTPVESCGSSDEPKNRHILGSASEPETEEVRKYYL
jgi:uncharacterized protein YhaN